MKSEVGKNGMLGTFHLLSREGNFVVAAGDDEAETDAQKNGDAVAYFEEALCRPYESAIQRSARVDHSNSKRDNIRSKGTKRDKCALWTGRNSQPKSGLLPDSRIANRLNRIANRGGKPSKRLRRYSGYRTEYWQKIFVKRLQQSLAE